MNWNVRGPQGPQGPGEHLLNFASDGTNGHYVFLRKVEGYVFKAYCSVGATSTLIKLHYFIPAGVTTSEAGSVITSSSYAFHLTGYSGAVNLDETTTTTSGSVVLDYTIVGSNGRSVQLYVTVSADNTPTPPDKHCYVTGTVTPIPS